VLEREALLDRRPRRPTHPLGLGGMLQEVHERLTQCDGIARRHVEAVLSVADQPGAHHAAGAGQHDGLPHRHQLENRRDARLEIDVEQRHHPEPGARVELAEIRVVEVPERHVGR